MDWKRLLIASAIGLASLSSTYAQSDHFGVWTDITLEHKINKKLGVAFDAEYRTTDGLSQSDRISGTLEAEYRLLSWLKASGGYSLIYNWNDYEITKKGNIVSDYWQLRHRFFVSLTGSLSWNRFKFSLRERWQYTYRPENTVTKHDEDGDLKPDEIIKGKGKNVLRSRLKVEYDIKGIPVTPFASYELHYSSELDKNRWIAGGEYKINKKNSIELYYLYQDVKDDDELNGHAIGISYKLKL